MRILIIFIFASFSLAACAKTSTIQLSSNQARVLVDAATVCGPTGAQSVAYQHAAVATIRQGHDRFLVLNIGSSRRTAGGSTSTYGQGGPSTTTFNTPWTRHGSDLHIEMFREGDPQGLDAVSARDILGDDWQAIVERGGPGTC